MHAAVTVREAGSSDIPALSALRAAWREHELTPSFLDAFAEWFGRERSSRWWWLAEAAGEPVGMVNVKVFDRMPSPGASPSRWGYLSNLFVAPTHRGSGVGGQLIDALLTRAVEERLVRVVLSPSTASVPLYLRHGFVMAEELLVHRLACRAPHLTPRALTEASPG